MILKFTTEFRRYLTDNSPVWFLPFLIQYEDVMDHVVNAAWSENCESPPERTATEVTTHQDVVPHTTFSNECQEKLYVLRQVKLIRLHGLLNYHGKRFLSYAASMKPVLFRAHFIVEIFQEAKKFH